MKALETSDKKDDTKWLTYWVLFAVLTIIEHFSFVVHKIIPFYFLLKVSCFINYLLLRIYYYIIFSNSTVYFPYMVYGTNRK